MRQPELKNISPEEAARFLEKNTNNRALTEQQVRYYAQQMKAGEWTYDGQPIRFAEDGQLLDGQHRLTALVESNTTFLTTSTRVILNISFVVVPLSLHWNRGPLCPSRPAYA